ncbi:hypothetical protein [Amycolatopsis sp. H20-H5]|uniref:hypothetical protein n=1 Tax=Amycolatopsis sp. H20-H5 TaxID=3046309 RepID=UPI002DBDAE67|nr:hypothetical protein [Amycolatopsis sp. H20-H5]MEC3977138.1 hypothetical protein [Amycolatopsis sp. H20-H5]
MRYVADETHTADSSPTRRSATSASTPGGAALTSATASCRPGSRENGVSSTAIEVSKTLTSTHQYRTNPHRVPSPSTTPVPSASRLIGTSSRSPTLPMAR